MNEKPRSTASGQPPADDSWDAPAPQPIDPKSGQHRDHWVLPEGERVKGFVRPYRDRYRHVGPPGPVYPLRDLTPDERKHYASCGYAKFEQYPESESPKIGRFWTQAQLDAAGHGCDTVTTMGRPIAETYACNPSYYGSTFCTGCGKYLPVAEFCWLDGSRVGS